MLFLDRIKQATLTEGTGTYTVSSVFVGFEAFSKFNDGDQTCYCCEDGIDWEIGLGTIGGGGSTVTRDEIISSSNADAAVIWGVGSKLIYCVYPSKYVFTAIGGLFKNYAETVFSANDGQINLADGNVCTMTLSGAVTVALTGATAGQCHSLTIHIYGGDTHSVTWPASVSHVAAATYDATAHDIVSLHTIDGGTTWFFVYVGAVL